MGDQIPSDMRTEFRNLWRRSLASGHPDPVFNLLDSLYAAPGRRYHTMEHVGWALLRLREISPAPSAESEWAIWFHDAVLSRRPDDEAQSAKLAVMVARVAGMPLWFEQRVEHLILATGHDEAQFDGEAMAVCDADLSILGARDEVFDDYEARVRTEWKDVPESAFRMGRISVLQRFLDPERGSVFQTQAGRHRWEEQAVRNIRRSIQRLSSGAPIPTEPAVT